MNHEQRLLAAIVYGAGEGEHADRVLSQLAHLLQDQSYQVAGTVQRAVERADRCACDMIVRDLFTGFEVQISEDRGANARGCRLDPGMLEALVGSTTAAMEGGVDAVIINKFGKREAQGDGFRNVIAQALLSKTPLIVGVNVAYLDSWRSFADALADELVPDNSALFDWISQRLALDTRLRHGPSELLRPTRVQ